MNKRPSLAETMQRAATMPEPPLQTALARPNLPPSPGRETGYYAATRVGKKKITATLAPADHKRLRQLALERDVTTEALLTEAISDLFAKYGQTTIGQGEGAS